MWLPWDGFLELLFHHVLVKQCVLECVPRNTIMHACEHTSPLLRKVRPWLTRAQTQEKELVQLVWIWWSPSVFSCCYISKCSVTLTFLVSAGGTILFYIHWRSTGLTKFWRSLIWTPSCKDNHHLFLDQLSNFLNCFYTLYYFPVTNLMPASWFFNSWENFCWKVTFLIRPFVIFTKDIRLKKQQNK